MKVMLRILETVSRVHVKLKEIGANGKTGPNVQSHVVLDSREDLETACKYTVDDCQNVRAFQIVEKNVYSI